MTISPATGLALESIADVDPVLWEAMLGERRRQHDKIELIASENYTSAAVMEAQGSWLTNKYAEGLPGKRYYGGCEYVDIAERLAQERALALFPGAEHVNVQPHSGRAGEHGRLLQRPRAGRPDHGHEPRPRRPPDPRHGAQLLGPAVRGPRLRRPPGHRADRLRRDGRPGEGGPPEAHRRWRVGLSADSGTSSGWPSIAEDVGAILFIDMAHIAGLVAAGRPPEPVPARRPRDDDDPQDAPRPARRDDLQPRRTLRPGLDAADFPTVKNGAADGALARLGRPERPSRASRAAR